MFSKGIAILESPVPKEELIEFTLNNDELKQKVDLTLKLAEIKTYDALVAVAASKSVSLDLDDGVKTNYPKISQAAADAKPGSEILEMKGVKL